MTGAALIAGLAAIVIGGAWAYGRLAQARLDHLEDTIEQWARREPCGHEPASIRELYDRDQARKHETRQQLQGTLVQIRALPTTFWDE